MKKYFAVKEKATGNPMVVEYKADIKTGEAILSLTMQEYRLIQRLATTDFPSDWVDQDTGTEWHLFDARDDGGDNVMAIYTRE